MLITEIKPEHKRQCTRNYYNVEATSRTTVTVKCNKYNIFCVCVFVCVCVCVCVVLAIQHAKRMRRIISSCVASLAVSYFSALSHKRPDFRRKLLNIK